MKQCDVCGKDTETSGFSIAGFVFQIVERVEMTEETMECLKKQFGPYEIKDYIVCIECWLRSWGIKPKGEHE